VARKSSSEVITRTPAPLVQDATLGPRSTYRPSSKEHTRTFSSAHRSSHRSQSRSRKVQHESLNNRTHRTGRIEPNQENLQVQLLTNAIPPVPLSVAPNNLAHHQPIAPIIPQAGVQPQNPMPLAPLPNLNSATLPNPPSHLVNTHHRPNETVTWAELQQAIHNSTVGITTPQNAIGTYIPGRSPFAAWILNTPTPTSYRDIHWEVPYDGLTDPTDHMHAFEN